MTKRLDRIEAILERTAERDEANMTGIEAIARQENNE
ncbi:hypothetical protein NIES4072_21020 [Nostoc commune NIES-4072]|uniref:Uncharacterized protein n=1 Tax=Nostoc commune NIES-4072 TaxID=2005467 RepID=A0A2R5FIA4_NOSCO|nr:hypothetical protein NIES4070_05780 [Nostoc commune HK-02]GBG18437.1 hypothetical protein NIES4072_21020 [Nostoc commune NIES-4072]